MPNTTESDSDFDDSDDDMSFGDCGGQYCPGTEECDWCDSESECAAAQQSNHMVVPAMKQGQEWR